MESEKTQGKDNFYLPKIEYIVERKNMPDWVILKSRVNFYDLTYICGGRAVYIIDGIPHNLAKGDCIFVPRGSSREAYTDSKDPVHLFAINFNILFSEFDADIFSLPLIMHLGDDQYLADIFKRMNRLWLEREFSYKTELSGMLIIAISHLERYKLKLSGINLIDNRVEIIKQHVVNNFGEKLTNDGLSLLVNLHPVYMGKLFHKTMGYTVKDYINRIRINKACDLLSSDEYTVTKTALLCGYEDLYYFSKVFKKYMGISPSEWR